MTRAENLHWMHYIYNELIELCKNIVEAWLWFAVLNFVRSFWGHCVPISAGHWRHSHYKLSQSHEQDAEKLQLLLAITIDQSHGLVLRAFKHFLWLMSGLHISRLAQGLMSVYNNLTAWVVIVMWHLGETASETQVKSWHSQADSTLSPLTLLRGYAKLQHNIPYCELGCIKLGFWHIWFYRPKGPFRQLNLPTDSNIIWLLLLKYCLTLDTSILLS